MTTKKLIMLLSALLILIVAIDRNEIDSRIRFPMRKPYLDRLVEMMRKDKLQLVAGEIDADISRERWDDYKEVFNQIGVSRLVYSEGGYTFVPLFHGGFMNHCWSEGYVYIPNDTERAVIEAPFSLSKLEDHWYWYHRSDR